jgi:hypothetical protein
MNRIHVDNVAKKDKTPDTRHGAVGLQGIWVNECTVIKSQKVLLL